MIILDEQLQGRGIESSIARWYPGAVRFIMELRPGSVIKDDNVPALLNEQRGAIFVTINIADFWQRISMRRWFCVVCVAVPDSRALEVPDLLKRLLRGRPDFRTAARRSGCIFRITENSAAYYTVKDSTIRSLKDWQM